MVKFENCPVTVGEEEQQLLDEVQEGSVVCKFCADPVEDIWSDQGCVSELNREHHDWSAALKHYLGCLRICLQVKPGQVSRGDFDMMSCMQASLMGPCLGCYLVDDSTRLLLQHCSSGDYPCANGRQMMYHSNNNEKLRRLTRVSSR